MGFSKTSAALVGFVSIWANVVYGTQTINRLHTPPGGGLVFGRMDPIISPGKDSAHVHMVVGGNGFSDSMAKDDALNAKCTNSQIKNDGSNYWVPSLYFHKDNKFTSVPMNYMNVYYKMDPHGDKIVPWEPGFRMISGNPFLRSPPATSDTVTDTGSGKPIQPVQMTCATTDGGVSRWPQGSDGMHGVGIASTHPVSPTQPTGDGVGFPNQNCDVEGSPLRYSIDFPSCSNPNVPIDDYENNSAFPEGDGKCKPGWLHHPHMFYEVYWSTMDFAGQWKTGEMSQPFVLANGDSTGYGLHGDFIAGWDKDTLQTIIDTCNTVDGGMDGCPNISADLIYSGDDIKNIAEKCNVKAPNPEKVLGTLDQLPGCNPVTGAGPDAPKNPTCPGGQAPNAEPSNANPVAPTTTAPVTQPMGTHPVVPVAPGPKIPQSGSGSHTGHSSSQAGPSGWSSLGCFADKPGARILNGPNENRLGGGVGDGSLMTISMCTDFCGKQGYEVAGLEWKSECYCGHAAPTEKSDQCTSKCAGDASQTCGGWGAMSVYQKGAGKVKRTAAAHVARHRLHARSMGHAE